MLYRQYWHVTRASIDRNAHPLTYITLHMFGVGELTPFFPGMAHSQFIRFIVPSGFFVGTATKPCKTTTTTEPEPDQSRVLFISLCGCCCCCCGCLQTGGLSSRLCAPGTICSERCQTLLLINASLWKNNL